jgi:hypothetical protein
MKLKVIRFSSQKDSTNGLLFNSTAGNKFLCYTLEDERREKKVKAETRIPSGTYKILLRKEGGFHARYESKYGSMHKGMLHIQDVPGFEWILIHTGNTDEHTAGCLILGDTQENNIIAENGFVGRSTTAYKRVYPLIAKELEKGEEVTIEYIDLD